MNIIVDFLKYQSDIYYFACDLNQNVEGFDVVQLANI